METTTVNRDGSLSGRKSPFPAQWTGTIGVVVSRVPGGAGMALGFVPGIPGFVVSLIGLGILSMQIKAVAGWCDRTECALRRLVR